jgi:hypothetical protein
VGTKRPDQISSDQWRRGVETVRQMHERRWELVGRCRSCGVALLVDLRVTISMLGPDFSLWNKHTQCRALSFGGRCRGVVDFHFRAPGMTQHRPLTAPDREPLP